MKISSDPVTVLRSGSGGPSWAAGVAQAFRRAFLQAFLQAFLLESSRNGASLIGAGRAWRFLMRSKLCGLLLGFGLLAAMAAPTLACDFNVTTAAKDQAAPQHTAQTQPSTEDKAN
jgi:hypothetical protein